MSNPNPTHPYTVDIVPCEKPAGHFRWAIRRSGKLIERSDRPHYSEQSARERAEEAIQRQFRGDK